MFHYVIWHKRGSCNLCGSCSPVFMFLFLLMPLVWNPTVNYTQLTVCINWYADAYRVGSRHSTAKYNITLQGRRWTLYHNDLKFLIDIPRSSARDGYLLGVLNTPNKYPSLADKTDRVIMGPQSTKNYICVSVNWCVLHLIKKTIHYHIEEYYSEKYSWTGFVRLYSRNPRLQEI